MGTFGVVSTETGESGRQLRCQGGESREKTVAALALPGIGRTSFLEERGEAGKGLKSTAPTQHLLKLPPWNPETQITLQYL